MKKYSVFYLIPVLLMLAVPFQTAADDFLRGDVDLDGNVNISDVTCLIDYLLSNQWPEEGEPETVTYVLNGIEINMVKVEGGTFTMGASGADTEAYDNEYPAHIVTLSDFYICTTEVTQQLWRAVMGSNPSGHTGNVLYPVEAVSWSDCKNFITKLNQMTGQNFRLPTEAEWEFAARGGIKSKGYKYSGSDDVNEVAWYYTGSNDYGTKPVATKKPNELGLYDMSGNVSEWCNDYYTSTYSSENQTNPQGPTTGVYRVFRGGSYSDYAKNCRVSYRYYYSPNTAHYDRGLRLAL